MKIKPLFLACSDTHLRPDKPDTFFAFEQIINRALALKVPIIGAGDLIDKQSNRATTIVFLAKQLHRLHEKGLKFYYTQGQHEFDAVPWMQIAPNTEHLHRQTLEFGEVTVYGLDWQPTGKLQEEFAEIPEGVDMLIAHQVWGDWMGDIAAPQGTFAQVPGHIKFVVTGDLHQWKLEKKKNADGEKMIVCSNGATTQQKRDEPDEHFYSLFYPDLRFEPIRLKSRVVIDAGLMSKSEDLDRFVTEFEAELAAAEQKAAGGDYPPEIIKPYLNIEAKSVVTDALRRIEKAVGDRAILRFKSRVPEEKTAAYQKAAKAGKGEAVTPLSLLKDEVDKAENPNTYELCERLLLASDKEMEFALWRSEWMGEVEKKEQSSLGSTSPDGDDSDDS